MQKFKVIGYIDCPAIATGFLIPIYQNEEKMFFHKLSEDNRTVDSFTPYKKEDYEHEKYFVPIKDGPEKEPGVSSFFVFKYKNSTSSGSCDDSRFIEHMQDFKKRLSSQNTQHEIEKIFG